MINGALLLAALTFAVVPVEVVGCKTGVEVTDLLYKTNGNYEIDFIDRDKRTVDAVAFNVRLGSSVIRIRDAGTFSPGVLVSHRFANRGGEVVLAADPQISCEVKWVHFADGSDWRP